MTPSPGQSGDIATPLGTYNPVYAGQLKLADAVFNVAEEEKKVQEKAQEQIDKAEMIKLTSEFSNEAEGYERTTISTKKGEAALPVGDNPGVQKQAMTDYGSLVDKFKQDERFKKLSPNLQLLALDAFNAKTKSSINILGSYQDSQAAEHIKTAETIIKINSESAVKQDPTPAQIKTQLDTYSKMLDTLYDKPGQEQYKKQQLVLEESRLNALAAGQKDQNKITAIEVSLKEHPELTYEDKIGQVSSKDFLAANGAKIRDEVLRDLTNEETIRRDIYNKTAKKIVGEADALIFNSQPVPDELLSTLEPQDQVLVRKIEKAKRDDDHKLLVWNAQEVRAKSADARRAILENKQLKALQLQENDDKNYSDIMGRILDGDTTVNERDIWKLRSEGKLSRGTASELMTAIGKVTKEPRYRAGLDIVNTAWKKGILANPDANDPTGTIARGNLWSKYDKAIADLSASKPNYTQEDAIKVAEELMKPKVEDGILKRLGDLWSSLPSGTPLRGTTGAVGDTVNVKTVTIDGKPYRDGDVYTAPNSQKSVVRVK